MGQTTLINMIDICVSDPPNEWLYFPPQFQIICDRQYLTMMTEMIYMAIVGVGTVIGSHLGDR